MVIYEALFSCWPSERSLEAKMGGTLSKLKQTDWATADGNLASPDSTVDGAPPTKEYAVYYLTKKGVNQREYDITDSEKNLLFTTRAVPGTIVGFDVLGRGIDDFVLRVTADLARRYWIIYRYSIPAFEGQIPDKAESEKAAADLADTSVQGPLQLFKKCCVTVSWSRYLAVAAFYGPPTVEMLLSSTVTDDETSASDLAENSDDMIAENDQEDDLFQQASRIASRMRERASSVDSDDLPPQDSIIDQNEQIERNESDAPNNSKNDKAQSNESSSLVECDEAPILSCVSMPELRSSLSNAKDDESQDDSLAAASVHTAGSAARIATASAANIRSWIRQKSIHIREKSHAYLHRTIKNKHPLEGVIHLEKPLLLCQEIYNKLIGNHQTSVVSKEVVLELLKQDTAQHFKEHPEENEGTTQEDPILTVEGIQVILPTNEEGLTPGNGVDECKSEEIVVENTRSRVEEPKGGDENAAEGSDTQSLVGYWYWEHSLRSQRMKMQVAKGTDLALHVVIAILVNQVRYERNAIAMTI